MFKQIIDIESQIENLENYFLILMLKQTLEESMSSVTYETFYCHFTKKDMFLSSSNVSKTYLYFWHYKARNFFHTRREFFKAKFLLKFQNNNVAFKRKILLLIWRGPRETTSAVIKLFSENSKYLCLTLVKF